MTADEERGQLDLVVLVADQDQEFAIRGLLAARAADLRMRPVTTTTFRHPQRDPGCRKGATEFLRGFLRSSAHALVVFDHHGSGAHADAAAEVEAAVETTLSRNGWSERSACIVIEPELENWVWSDSPEVDRIVGWNADALPGARLRDWLAARGHWTSGRAKPADPKAALRAALREVRRQPSASLFEDLAERVPLQGCSDRAFLKLCSTLRTWFPCTA